MLNVQNPLFNTLKKTCVLSNSKSCKSLLSRNVNVLVKRVLNKFDSFNQLD